MKVAAIDGGACADDLEVIGDCDSTLSRGKDCANSNSVGIAIHRIGEVFPTGENRGGALESRGNAPLCVRQNFGGTQLRIAEEFRVRVPARFVFKFFGITALGEVGDLLRSPIDEAAECVGGRVPKIMVGIGGVGSNSMRTLALLGLQARHALS